MVCPFDGGDRQEGPFGDPHLLELQRCGFGAVMLALRLLASEDFLQDCEQIFLVLLLALKKALVLRRRRKRLVRLVGSLFCKDMECALSFTVAFGAYCQCFTFA